MSDPWLQYWPRLKAALSRSTTISNWTKDRGEVGDKFEAVAKGDYVIVAPPNGNVRNIYFGEMVAVYNVWEGYLAGKVPRSRDRSCDGNLQFKVHHQYLPKVPAPNAAGVTPPSSIRPGKMLYSTDLISSGKAALLL